MSEKIYSNSQSGQDIWVLQAMQGARNGFYLEIGGGDGLWISNTLLLERKFDWTGILVEPTSAFEKLCANRPASICDNSCISSEQKEVTVHEIHDKGQSQISNLAQGNTLLSTVTTAENEQPSVSDTWGELRKSYKRKTITLDELLDRHKAPKVIDYFSLDVEGHEYEILKNFSFDRYRFRILGVERPSKRLHKLLLGNGYDAVAQCGEDIMYINRSLAVPAA